LIIPAPYMLVALAVAVTVVQNSALHAGALQASVPIMLVGEPVVAVLLGMVVLGEHVGVRGPGAIVLVVAVWAMVSATVALARSQAGDRAEQTVPQQYSAGESEDRFATAGSQPPRT
jgi:threonine/homoserine efflux transporter RhtA